VNSRPATLLKRQPESYSWIVLCLAALNCIFQIVWFWRFHAHNITLDGISYIGLARHLLEGDFVGSLHGYWSPLYSWLIAAGSIFTRDLTVLAHLITIACTLLCMPLVYLLSYKLWRSRLTASFSVLWFSTIRGLFGGAGASIEADLLFTAIVLIYFVLLITCLRRGTKLNWLLLGNAHAVAFLAKAFAMPWLALSTFLAVLVSNRKSMKSATVSLLLAALAPGIVWLSWGEALKVKYGAFTTGYQFRANLMIGLKRKMSHYPRGDSVEFVDIPYDQFMVSQMDWPSLQKFSLRNPELASVIFGNEIRNIPEALKQEAILLSPGGILVLIVGLVLLARSGGSHTPETVFAWIAVINFATLVGAYGMLVFDARYILPITPVLISIAAYFLVPNSDSEQTLRTSPKLQLAGLGLLLVSTVFFTVYWASPFRTIDRDFQASCYQAASELKSAQPDGATLVSIGNGPYPDRGVGFEAGEIVAYFTGRRLLAMNYALPEASNSHALVEAVLNKQADAVLVWGSAGDSGPIVGELRDSPRAFSDQAILDPTLGEVGRVVFFGR
jgi:4-amino-4-deoxy-L-arabinose transferase-like glycosyltransferase